MRARAAVWPRLGTLWLPALLCGACSQPAYLARLGWEEARLLARRQPISVLLARDDLDAEVRDRLELVLSARRFAREALGLRVNEVFTSFADVDGQAVVYVVTAAYRDRLEAYTWWYPLVGRVPYRGFFDQDDAQETGRSMEARGFDVDVRPAVAFSTLGWLPDPLLSPMLALQPVELVETVLHELAHVSLWIPGEVAFNESAATFVGHRGAVAYFCAGPRAQGEHCETARDRWTRMRRRARLFAHLVRRLEALSAMPMPRRAYQARRAAIHRSAARGLVRHGLGNGASVYPPNNARLLAALVYMTRLEDFEALVSRDAGLGPALARLRAALRNGPQPFAALDALLRSEAS